MDEVTACMIVKNEDRFVWYSISSILSYVDRFIIFDTGSTDKTIEIIKIFKSPKIIFRPKKQATPELLTAYRQEQAEMIKKGWLWIVDADEVYPTKTAEKVISVIRSRPDLDGIIIHRYDLLGDIYHCQDESVGIYHQFGRIGHYVLRLINKNHFPKLQVKGEYPAEYFAQNGRSIKENVKDRFAFIEERIFHAMYLQRSAKGRFLFDVLNRQKYKIELGSLIPNREIPEIFFKSRPSIIPDVKSNRTFIYYLLAFLITPIKKIKRKFIS